MSYKHNNYKNGLCNNCNRENNNGKKLCDTCLGYKKKRRNKNYDRLRYLKGYCNNCNSRLKETEGKLCKDCRSKTRSYYNPNNYKKGLCNQCSRKLNSWDVDSKGKHFKTCFKCREYFRNKSKLGAFKK
ncbi:MAG: hypothetical protein ACRCXT_00655 [Paraclostridium sp.]